MNYVRLGQQISHECESQLRDLAAYMGALLNLGKADDERNPLRAEVVGAALNRGIEAISGERESRRILARDLDLLAAHRRALATAFPGQASAVDSMRDAAPAPAPRSSGSRGRGNVAADQQLMTLLRRLTAVSSSPGWLEASAFLGATRGGGGG